MHKKMWIFNLAVTLFVVQLFAGTGVGESESIFLTSLPPAAPELSAPVNEEISVPDSTSLCWHPLLHAGSFQLRVSTIDDFSELLYNENSIDDTCQTMKGLERGTTHYWQVRAQNVAGWGDYSSVWHFTTLVDLPNEPELKSPANGSQNLALTVPLLWNSAAGAESYNVQIAIDSLFSELMIDSSGLVDTSYTVTDLSNDTPYFWRVRANNIAGGSEFSDVWQFRTIVASPDVPALTSPLNGSQNMALTVPLVWRPVDIAETYHVQVAANESFTDLIVDSTGLADTTFIVSDLINDTTYFWRVSANNIGGSGDFSTVWQFRTIVGAPDVPMLVSPINGTQNVPVAATLKWHKVPKAETYNLKVSETPGFEEPFITETDIADTTYTLGELAYKTQYHWRVSAQNIGGIGNWSGAATFSTIVQTPLSPVLSMPEDGATGLAPNVELVWHNMPDVDTWHLQVSNTSDFSNLTIDEPELADTLFQTELDPESIWHWRVRAANIGGEGPFSSIRTFSTGTTGIDEQAIPTEYCLFQNYPNPFNPVTQISFALPQKSNVEISIYNLKGQLVESVFNQTTPAGVHHLRWNALNQPSGTYFIKMTAGKFQQIQKCLLLK